MSSIDPYEKQKDAAGGLAAIVWIASGLFLYLTTEGASLLSWSALAFFFVGMFAAALVFGIAFYWLQRGVVKAFSAVTTATPIAATAIYSFAWMLLIVEAVAVFLAASWAFHKIS